VKILAKLVLKVQRLAYVKVPERKTEGSAAFDLYLPHTKSAWLIEPTKNAKARKIPLGIAVKIPKGHAGIIVLRSSTGLKNMLRIPNGFGLIDEDYTGELNLILVNDSNRLVVLQPDERIAQLLIVPYRCPDIELLDEGEELEKTERGTGGMGSTGT